MSDVFKTNNEIGTGPRSPRDEETIFAAAWALPPEERAACLEKECGDDVGLRRRVEALLNAHAGASFLEEPAAPGASPAVRESPILSEQPGDCIGRYKLLQQIGEGGCGVVYMAEQEKPVQRRVALKIIKLGMDTKQVVARFEAERQALAMMDHPNIAKVLDGGATETGRPYFVMELVRGVKITEYCDHNNLPTGERLELFMQVCRAIQHAHQKGIIHRDIKPSNILVTLHDGVPVPKVIDFGIAKATQGRLTDMTLFTAFEQFIGTPAYMSPEQAVMTSLDIDTRSDIYSLGVLLYELLTGKTPFEAKELLEAGLDAMRRTIQEKEPERPSTKLSTMAQGELTITAKRHHTEAPKLITSVRGDLDWIVMKCLEKDRSRRYETANGLASDIQRHLEEEPVAACPPSNLYRFRKLVHRNKLTFAAAAGVTASLLIGLGVSTWMYFQEREAKREQARLRMQALAKEKRAETEAAKSQQVAEFLKDMLKGVTPDVAMGRDTTLLKEILDRTAARIGRDLTNQPEVEAELRVILGQTYHLIGRYTECEEMNRQALAIEKRVFGSQHITVADSLGGLGLALYSYGKLAEAEAADREALELRRKLLGNSHPKTADSICLLAIVLLDEGKLAESEALHREALAIRRQQFGEDHADVAFSLNNLANTLRAEGNLEEAELTYRRALELRQKLLSADSPSLASTPMNLGLILMDQGRLEEAEPFLREGVARYDKVLGERHSYTIRTLNNLALFLEVQGRDAEAKQVYREIIKRSHNLVDLSDARVLDILAWLMATSKDSELRDGPSAIAFAEKAVATTARKQPAYLEALAAAYAEAGQFEKATDTQKELIALLKRDFAKGEALARLQLYESGLPFRADRVADKLNEIAWFLATSANSKLRNAERAITFAVRAVAASDRKQPAFLDTLAAAYAEAGQFDHAVSVQKEAMMLEKDDSLKTELAAHLKLFEAHVPYHEQ